MTESLPYRCTACGSYEARWFERCPSCRETATIRPVSIPRGSGGAKSENAGDSDDDGSVSIVAKRVGTIAKRKVRRVSTGIRSLDDVLGGGVVLGNCYVIGGSAGSGKSTLALQMARAIRFGNVLYAVKEMPEDRSKQYAERVGFHVDSALYIDAETDDIETLLEQAFRLKVRCLVLDSVQKYSSSAPKLSDAGRATPRMIRHIIESVTNQLTQEGVTAIIVSQVTHDEEFQGGTAAVHEGDSIYFLESESKRIKRLYQRKERDAETDTEMVRLQLTHQGFTDAPVAETPIVEDDDEPPEL